MNDDIYQKIAIEIAVKAGDKDSFACLLTSSSPKLDCTSVAQGLLTAYQALHMNAAVIRADSLDELASSLKAINISEPVSENELTVQKAQNIVTAALNEKKVAIFVAPVLPQNNMAMLLASVCGKVVLYEKRKVSRSDQIESTLDTVRALHAEPIGFILQ